MAGLISGMGGAGSAASPPLGVVHPCWLIATGDKGRVEVLRSPIVRVTDSMYEPVARFIGEHGLVLAARETFPEPDFMFGEVEVSVYVAPAVRNGVLAGTEISLPWHGGALAGVGR